MRDKCRKRYDKFVQILAAFKELLSKFPDQKSVVKEQVVQPLAPMMN